jgi:hypothetical protein
MKRAEWQPLPMHAAKHRCEARLVAQKATTRDRSADFNTTTPDMKRDVEERCCIEANHARLRSNCLRTAQGLHLYKLCHDESQLPDSFGEAA